MALKLFSEWSLHIVNLELPEAVRAVCASFRVAISWVIKCTYSILKFSKTAGHCTYVHNGKDVYVLYLNNFKRDALF